MRRLVCAARAPSCSIHQSATEAEPHAAPCCTSRQAAAVVDHVGIHKGRLGRKVISPIGIHGSGRARSGCRRPRWHPQRSPWSGGGGTSALARAWLSVPVQADRWFRSTRPPLDPSPFDAAGLVHRWCGPLAGSRRNCRREVSSRVRDGRPGRPSARAASSLNARLTSHARRSPDGPHRAKVALSRSSDRDRLGITFSHSLKIFQRGSPVDAPLNQVSLA